MQNLSINLGIKFFWNPFQFFWHVETICIHKNHTVWFLHIVWFPQKDPTAKSEEAEAAMKMLGDDEYKLCIYLNKELIKSQSAKSFNYKIIGIFSSDKKDNKGHHLNFKIYCPDLEALKVKLT